MISNIVNSKYPAKIGKEKCKEFGEWYINFRRNEVSQASTSKVSSEKLSETRLTFHPTKELPLLRSWFQASRTPSERTLQLYVEQLNKAALRQERPKVTLNKLKNWWKNERQRERRTQSTEEKGQKRVKRRRETEEPQPSTSHDHRVD